ncbi:hypothetical protein [uncultured Thomasclavelia sp.]|uniref:hypothetical protein n=1 Tax=uncultured Thomasclavelia sp. TaxID=3025759 RepID=UPI0025FD1813|nr:hypothetical protein [uncultured Thomasclavelia sp.]
MLKTLVKVRLQGLFLKSLSGSKQKKVSKLKIVLFSLLFLYVAIILTAAFGYLFYLVLDPFTAIGYEWLFFALMAVVIIVFCFVGSVFTTQQEIYGAKDNELLLSMPIKTRDILLSRILVVLILNYIYEALIALPGIVVYYWNRPFDIFQFLIFLIVMLTLPLFVLALTCVFGWLLAMVLKKINNKTVITLILSLAFLGIYFYLVNRIPGYLVTLAASGQTIGEIISSKLFPIYHLAIAICQNNLISLLIYLLCAIIPFVIVVNLLSHNFIKLTTTKTGSKKEKLKISDIKTNKAKKALFIRELRHYGSNPMVILNTGLGIAFTVFLAGALLVKGHEFLLLFDEIPVELTYMLNEWLVAILCLVVICCSCFNTISSSLISLEGNRLWIIKSLPISSKDILDSKLLLHLVLCLPAGILFSLVAVIVFSLNVIDALLVLLVPVVFTVFEAVYGLLVNLWKPKFDWVNETVVVKQSLAVTIAIFGSMAIAVLIVIGYVLIFSKFIDISLYTYIIFGLFVILDIYGYYLLNTWGIKRFEQL